jgi:predicted SpoU family rRNA methylase
MRRTTMNSEGTEAPTLIRLLSVPGLVALALLGIMVLAASRIVGADTIVREIVTEVIASFGNAILVLAVFGLFFRTGLERLLRRAPGGDTVAESAEHLRELLGDFDQRGRDVEGSQYGAKVDRIDATVRSLAYESIPALQSEVEALRRLILDAEQERGTR